MTGEESLLSAAEAELELRLVVGIILLSQRHAADRTTCYRHHDSWSMMCSLPVADRYPYSRSRLCHTSAVRPVATPRGGWPMLDSYVRYLNRRVLHPHQSRERHRCTTVKGRGPPRRHGGDVRLTSQEGGWYSSGIITLWHAPNSGSRHIPLFSDA